MKKLTTMLLALIMTLSMAACSNDKNKIPTKTTQSATETITEADNIETIPEDNPSPDVNIPTQNLAPPENSTFSVRFIDVGQADSTLIECDGHYMLIDGGNKSDSSLIYSVLKSESIQKLDIVVGTHAHEDHIGGLPGAFNYTTADLTLCATKNYDSDVFGDFKKYADKNGGGITIPSKGDTYTLGSATIKILGVNEGTDTNNTSIVLKITYGKTSFLFTGDAERDAEQAILNSGADLSATVLKVGHHGSDTSTTYPFLREIMPTYAVISVGKDNSYGHPADEALSRLRDADATVYRTDLHGDIICTSDGENVTITTEKSTDKNVFDSGAASTPIPVPTPVPEKKEEVVATPPAQPVTTSYVGNKNTKKFHETTCKSVNQMKESNKYYYTGTRDGIINEGYVPCKNCNP